MAVVDKRPDGSERVRYDYEDYHIYIRKGVLSDYPDYRADSHWHEDLEFISVLSGAMDYSVNGRIYHLHAGQGLLVNARQLHFGFSPQRRECVFLCILVHPMMLCATEPIERRYVAPFIGDGAAPCVLLSEQVPWQQEVLADMQRMFDSRQKPAAQLHIHSALYHLWALLAEHSVCQKPAQDRHLSVLKAMLLYIQRSYGQSITLAQIAEAGNVSKSTCLSVFKKYLRDTPGNYLTLYRLKQAAALLRSTDAPISEIALDVGFQGASWFSEAFRRHYGCTPSEYRKT